jgi:DNA-binding beta-propeller fold protein YncE
MVLDQDGNGIGKIEVGKDNEAHAVAFAPDLHRAFTSNGGGISVTILDPGTYKIVGELKIPERDTDDILYEPVTKRVFTFNGGEGHDATAIDASKGTVLASVPLGGKPETAQADSHGHVYANVEDESELREIDATTLKVTNVWPLAPCKNPSGMAIDTAHSLLVIGCHNGLMEFWDYGKNKVVGTVPKFSVVRTIATMKGARTMALDAETHRIYTVRRNSAHHPWRQPKIPIRGRQSNLKRLCC